MSEIYSATKLRRELHPMAEIGLDTVNTCQYVLRHLEAIGVKARRIGDTWGVLSEIDSGVPGETVMFRADMDALPFTVDGKKVAVHACGHDAHTAVLLEAASRLVGKIKRGKLLLLFQPAEETMEGARAVFEAGALDGVDIAIGAHVRPLSDLPVGHMSPAVLHGASAPIDVFIHGRNAHGSRPQLGVNAIEVASAIIGAVSQIHEDPTFSWSIKPTLISAGTAHNNIPDELKLGLDLRAQTNEIMASLQAKLEAIVKGACSAYGATGEIVHLPNCPAANLDKCITDEIAECIVETAGADALGGPGIGGGEDFHFFKLMKPELKNGYFGIGVGVTPGLHKINMTFDDKRLSMGADVFVRFAERHLG